MIMPFPQWSQHKNSTTSKPLCWWEIGNVHVHVVVKKTEARNHYFISSIKNDRIATMYASIVYSPFCKRRGFLNVSFFQIPNHDLFCVYTTKIKTSTALRLQHHWHLYNVVWSITGLTSCVVTLQCVAQVSVCWSVFSTNKLVCLCYFLTNNVRNTWRLLFSASSQGPETWTFLSTTRAESYSWILQLRVCHLQWPPRRWAARRQWLIWSCLTVPCMRERCRRRLS